jgi:iron complex transport system ATP-binding protein
MINPAPEPSPPLLHLDDVSVIRGGRSALDRVTLKIEQGENVAVLGPNGCGKSTLVKLIDRELYPKAGQGSMRILGRQRWNVAELRAELGIVTNDLQAQILPETPVTDAVVAGFTGTLGVYYDEASPERIDAAHKALVAANARHLAGRTFGALSSGEARRVLIARALAHDPSALLLDEPTTSLDLVSANALLVILRSLIQQGKSLLLVTHHLEEIVPEIDRVVLLRQGRVLLDGPREEVMTPNNLSELFEAPIELLGRGPYYARVRAH